jgi:hypothetical protein
MSATFVIAVLTIAKTEESIYVETRGKGSKAHFW